MKKFGARRQTAATCPQGRAGAAQTKQTSRKLSSPRSSGWAEEAGREWGARMEKGIARALLGKGARSRDGWLWSRRCADVPGVGGREKVVYWVCLETLLSGPDVLIPPEGLGYLGSARPSKPKLGSNSDCRRRESPRHHVHPGSKRARARPGLAGLFVCQGDTSWSPGRRGGDGFPPTVSFHRHGRSHQLQRGESAAATKQREGETVKTKT